MLCGPARFQTLPVALLLASALLLRALVPAGWMPAAGHGLGIEICADGSGVADPAFAAAAQRRFQQALGVPDRRGGDRSGDHPGKDQPCAFAGFALAWTGTDAPAMALPPPAIAPMAARAAAPVAIGRGLAAPPPPATGPPAQA